ncbi:MAG TPA: AIR synthase-related protein, partial [Methylophilus sp.]
GLALRGLAHSCIDVSDGLLADLGHILAVSNVGARLQLDSLPCLAGFKEQLHLPHVQQAVLAGGDDYELCFTAPVMNRDTIQKISNQLQLPLTRIGEVTQAGALEVYHHQQRLHLTHMGFDHFA